MGRRVTLQVEDQIVARALDIAGRSQRELEEVLEEWLGQFADELPLEALSDKEILSLCDDGINPLLKMQVRSLLLRESIRDLSPDEVTRLHELLHHYRKSIVKRARAIEISIERGLRQRADYI